jgi:Domain of unknown function (DUF4386)
MDSRKEISERNTARIVGVLYIIGTVSGVLSVAVTHSILGASDYLARIATHRSQMAVGALLVLTMGFALALVPVVFYPVGRRYSERLAMGYVVFRGLWRRSDSRSTSSTGRSLSRRWSWQCGSSSRVSSPRSGGHRPSTCEISVAR